MIDRKTAMSWLEWLTFDDWHMYHSDSEVQNIAKEALELIKEQEKQLEEYHKADTFLATHGWFSAERPVKLNE